MDRFLEAMDIPMLYEHVWDLGLLRSVWLSKNDPRFEKYAEAILPKESIALNFADSLIWPLTALSFLAFGVCFSRRKS